MEARYSALRTIATIYKVIGYIVLVLTILAALAVCGLSVAGGSAMEALSRDFGGTGIVSGVVGGLIAFVVILIYGGLIAVSLIAFGEGIYLFIAIEENTRKTSLLLENQVRPSTEPPPA